MKPHREFRHIVDVDGMLIGVDAITATPATLLARAGIATPSTVMMVVDDREIALAADDAITLTETRVVFLRTSPIRASVDLRRAA